MAVLHAAHGNTWLKGKGNISNKMTKTDCGRGRGEVLYETGEIVWFQEQYIPSGINQSVLEGLYIIPHYVERKKKKCLKCREVHCCSERPGAI